jgi:hypothetical protein
LTTTHTLDATDLKIIKARRNAVLRKMQMLSDAGAASLKPKMGKVASVSTPPSGVDLGELDGRTGAPPKSASLYAHYLWHFMMAQHDAERTRALCDCAEADYGEYVGGRRHQPGEGTEGRSKRILRDYRGWRPERAAHMEGVTPFAIRKLRSRSGYDAVTGERTHDVTLA